MPFIHLNIFQWLLEHLKQSEVQDTLLKKEFGLMVVPVESHCFSLDLRFNPTAKVLVCKKVSRYAHQEVGEELWEMVKCRILF